MTDIYTVLVLDDEPLWQNIIQLLLKGTLGNDGSEAYVVVSATSLAVALRELSSRAFDVAVVDINLRSWDTGNIEGMAFLELLKPHYAHNRTHAIMLSGRGTIQLAVDALKYPYVTDYLEKDPLDEDHLVAAIARGCMLARAGREHLLSVQEEETEE